MVKSKSKSKISKTSKKQSEASTLSPKEQAIQKRKAQQARKELIQFATISLSLAAVLGIILGAVGGVKAALAAFAIPLLGFSYKYYRHAFWAFLIYLRLVALSLTGLVVGISCSSWLKMLSTFLP
jgi:hypothetical protein